MTDDNVIEEIRSSEKRAKALVVRRNDLVFGRHKMSINQMRLFAWMVSEISSDDDEFKACRIHVKDFKDMVGLKGEKMYGEMVALTRSMMQHVVEVYDYDEKILRQRPLLSASDYKFGEGYVELKFHSDLKPYLLKVKERFLAVPLKSLLALPTGHSFRLYEIVRAERFKGVASFSEEELRTLLGIEKDEYTRFSNFKARVIAPSVEVLRRTDTPVDFSVKRAGKAVDRVEFRYLKPVANSSREVILQRLERHGMPAAEAGKAVDSRDGEELLRLLDKVDEMASEGRLKKTALAWLRGALNGWQRASGQEDEEAQKRVEAMRRQMEELKKAF